MSCTVESFSSWNPSRKSLNLFVHLSLPSTDTCARQMARRFSSRRLISYTLVYCGRMDFRIHFRGTLRLRKGSFFMWMFNQNHSQLPWPFKYFCRFKAVRCICSVSLYWSKTRVDILRLDLWRRTDCFCSLSLPSFNRASDCNLMGLILCSF